ncbi:MAG: hypothetical protein RLN62_03435 [Rickettsiales bacterium]
MTYSYADLTTDALIDCINTQTKYYADPSIKVQVQKLLAQKRDEVRKFVDQLIDLYHNKHPELVESMVCINSICLFEHAFLDTPITHDEDYVPDPLYNFLTAKSQTKKNSPKDVLNAAEFNNGYKYNKIIMLEAPKFLELLEICEKDAYERLHSQDHKVALRAARDIEDLALIRHDHTLQPEKLFSKILKLCNLKPKNSLEMLKTKLYMKVTKNLTQ